MRYRAIVRGAPAAIMGVFLGLGLTACGSSSAGDNGGDSDSFGLNPGGQTVGGPGEAQLAADQSVTIFEGRGLVLEHVCA